VFKFIKQIFKQLMGMVRRANFFCQVNLLEYKLDELLVKCDALRDDVRDKTILNDLAAIKYRVDYARHKIDFIRKRGAHIFACEEGGEICN